LQIGVDPGQAASLMLAVTLRTGDSGRSRAHKIGNETLNGKANENHFYLNAKLVNVSISAWNGMLKMGIYSA
jgi:hypothetical protein